MYRVTAGGDFIDHHELAGLGAQECIGVVQAAHVERSLEIEIDGPCFAPARGDFVRERGLAYLAWAEQYQAGQALQGGFDDGLEAAGKHGFRNPVNLTSDVTFTGIELQRHGV